MIIKVIFLTGMFYMALQDIKYHSISLKSLVLLTIGCVLATWIHFEDGQFTIGLDKSFWNVYNIGATVGFGGLLSVYAALTKGIGAGDVAVLVLASLLFGYWSALQMFVMGLLLMLAVVLIGIHRKYITYHQQIAFLPYLFLGGLGAILSV